MSDIRDSAAWKELLEFRKTAKLTWIESTRVAEEPWTFHSWKGTVSTVRLDRTDAVGSEPPTIFETDIIGGPHDGWAHRCMTPEDAKALHAAVVDALRAGTVPPRP